MKKIIILLMITIFTLSFGEDTTNPQEAVTINGTKVAFKGSGIRKKAFLKLYIGDLYVKDLSLGAKEIIDTDDYMSIRLQIISKLISNSAMKEAVEEGFTASTTKEEHEVLEERIESFIAVFSDEIVKGDRFRFDYVPGIGTRAYKNEKLLTTIPGLDFKEGLFGIWLGDKPADKNLKKGMIGSKK